LVFPALHVGLFEFNSFGIGKLSNSKMLGGSKESRRDSTRCVPGMLLA